MGSFHTSKAFFRLYSPHAKEAASRSRPPPGGRIVNVASQAAHVALDGHGPYCASKAGLIALTKYMANEWAPQGITANTVSPGVILTAMGRKAWADEAVKARHLMEIPTRRFAEAEEVAAAMETRCQEESGMINGADLRIDGGFTIR
ncbi:short chain dehydrogenase [Teratosphaeria destructans]|uniref:Short chain dehydrogenase n=1 Tax=Teratosphaeria destructans TaxID=418781 RepID=A0A9W7W426_9PEZI|nr:short chain dehydrogenase [Teratosphaeria destructans]